MPPMRYSTIGMQARFSTSPRLATFGYRRYGSGPEFHPKRRAAVVSNSRPFCIPPRKDCGRLDHRFAPSNMDSGERGLHRRQFRARRASPPDASHPFEILIKQGPSQLPQELRPVLLSRMSAQPHTKAGKRFPISAMSGIDSTTRSESTLRSTLQPCWDTRTSHSSVGLVRYRTLPF